MVASVRGLQLKYKKASWGAPSGRRKNPCKKPISGGENCALVLGKKSNYWITVKQARRKLHKRLAVFCSTKPFIIREISVSHPPDDDLIIEKVYSALLCRQMREHRDELIHQISKARTGKPRRAYIKPFYDDPYVPLPFGFGIRNEEKKQNRSDLKRKTGIRSSPVQCCYHLKEKPVKKYIKEFKPLALLWGNRASDSDRRKQGIADHGVITEPSSRWPCYSVQPLALFLDSDVERMVSEFNLTFEERAESGYQVCCTDLGRRDNQLTRCFVYNRAFFDKAILAGLGAQILKARGEPCGEKEVRAALENRPQRFLRIPRIGKGK